MSVSVGSCNVLAKQSQSLEARCSTSQTTTYDNIWDPSPGWLPNHPGPALPPVACLGMRNTYRLPSRSVSSAPWHTDATNASTAASSAAPCCWRCCAATSRAVAAAAAGLPPGVTGGDAPGAVGTAAPWGGDGGIGGAAGAPVPAVSGVPQWLGLRLPPATGAPCCAAWSPVGGAEIFSSKT